MQLIRTSTSKPIATLIRVNVLVPLGLESFVEDDTKNLHGDVYQANDSIFRAYLLVALLERTSKSYSVGPHDKIIVTNNSCHARNAYHISWEAWLSARKASAFGLVSGPMVGEARNGPTGGG